MAEANEASTTNKLCKTVVKIGRESEVYYVHAAGYALVVFYWDVPREVDRDKQKLCKDDE